MGAGLPLRRGFYTQGREVLVESVLGDQARIAVWTYLNSQKGYSTGHWRDRNEIILLKTGDVVCSIRVAAKACGMARETFKRTLTYLSNKGLLTFKSLKTGTLIRLGKSLCDAVLRPRGLPEAHKERKVSSRSYNSLPNYVAVSPAALVLDASGTKKYLDEMSRPAATEISQIAKSLLNKWRGK